MSPIHQIKITSRKSFINFLKLLQEDLRSNNEAWENKSLEDFLEAMTTYADDIQGFYDNTKPGENINADEASWQIFGDILIGARIYE
jgi:hypothetical protein